MNQRVIAPAFTVSFCCAIGLCITYALGGQPQVEGLLLFGAFGGFGTGLILWAKHLFPQEEVEQHRHQIESTPEEQKALDDLLGSGIEDVTRRRFLSKFAGGALGAIGIAALFPIKSLGPNPGNSLFKTEWRAGMHLTRDDGTFIKPTDLEEGGIFTVWPEGLPQSEESATLLIRYDETKFVPKAGRENWVVQGNVAYSKICTHVGCPVGLYRKATGQLLCPCHQSTFDVNRWAIPVFGPAARPLPQLPLELLPDGYLGAQSDYHEPVGPGFWNRGRKKVTV